MYSLLLFVFQDAFKPTSNSVKVLYAFVYLDMTAMRLQAYNICDFPQDILYRIAIQLHGNKTSLQSFAESCQTLYKIYHTLREGGEYAISIELPLSSTISPGLAVSTSPLSSKTMIQKTQVPGDAYIVFPCDVTQTSAIWHFQIENFEGHRIEIGVATEDAFRFGMVERASSWSFDCFGRACLAGSPRTYGRQMRNQDVIGVLYDAMKQSISFVDNGVSMGSLPIRSGTGSRIGTKALLPFVYFPYYCGECVSYLPVKRSLVNMKQVHSSAVNWKRPSGLPYDNCIIVATWEERVWYAIRANPGVTTLGCFWRELQRRHGMEMHLFELIFNGKRLQNRHDILLEDVGIVIDDKTGTCCSDMLLSVPHMVS